MSGLGKGVVTASIAKLLQLRGYKLTCAKIDPYLNVDAGTMNPLIHGEVFVTDDGGETDMDIGTYERFLDQNLSAKHNITTGQVYQAVIEAERRGDYLGSCVQIIPHITDEIKRRIREIAKESGVDILITECGGTVGDIEGLPYLEAFRQMRLELGAENCLFVHVTLAPILKPVGEQKTKPTQHSVQELRRIGIQPDIIVVRCKQTLTKEARKKIALFTSVEENSVISNPDVESVYLVPQVLEREGIVKAIERKLGLKNNIVWGNWTNIAESFIHANKGFVKIAMIGKYVSLADSYVSVNHALLHSATKLGYKLKVDWIDSEKFEKDLSLMKELNKYHGILVPGGFGKRGSEGKILVANYAREKGIPFLGICFGFQMAVVSFARYVANLKNANSSELDPNTQYSVIDILPEQKKIKELGGTMRLGGHDIEIVEGTKAYKIYGKKMIRERHRHRYEVNPKFRKILEDCGLVFSGFSDNGLRVEILEIENHPFYMATQYHPEFVSRPGKPEPIYLNFVMSACKRITS